MNLSPLDLIIIALATWRVSSLLTREDGPFLAFRWLRERTGMVHNDEGNIVAYGDSNPLHCLWCISLYVTPVCYAIWIFSPVLITILAISTLVVFIEVWGTRNG